MLSISSKRYLILFSSFIALGFAIVLLFNSLIDPLWHLSGNLITHKNYVFNERIAKMNRFLKKPKEYDCFIFGSSRVTLLPETEIQGYNCFNFSFSAGRVGEFYAFAKYLRNKKYLPKLVIIGLDGMNFFDKNVEESIPDYIIRNKNPPNILSDYLSIDVLKISLRAIQGISPLHRYYREDFLADILANAPPYIPTNKDAEASKKQSYKYYKENLKWYKKLLEIFDDSKVVMYVPPVSLWEIYRLKNENILENYILAIHSVSSLRTDLYDFSIPSTLTANKERTYDGSHYDLITNRYIIDAINTGFLEFGIIVNGLSYHEYRDKFLSALDGYKVN